MHLVVCLLCYRHSSERMISRLGRVFWFWKCQMKMDSNPVLVDIFRSSFRPIGRWNCVMTLSGRTWQTIPNHFKIMTTHRRDIGDFTTRLDCWLATPDPIYPPKYHFL